MEKVQSPENKITSVKLPLPVLTCKTQAVMGNITENCLNSTKGKVACTVNSSALNPVTDMNLYEESTKTDTNSTDLFKKKNVIRIISQCIRWINGWISCSKARLSELYSGD